MGIKKITRFCILCNLACCYNVEEQCAGRHGWKAEFFVLVWWYCDCKVSIATDTNDGRGAVIGTFWAP